MSVDIRKINQRNQLKSTVDILNPNSYTQNPETGMYNTDPSPMTSPVAQQRNNLDRQVEVGLGIWLKEKLSDSQKRDYANHLSDAQWEQMQQYKKEGYSFEASKAMIDNQNKMLDPTATWVNKFKDYNLKEQYYNNGYDIDPDSALWKTAQFLQKIGFKDWGNPITALANNYNEWYANYLNSYTEEGDNAPWLARVPLSVISSVLWSAGKISEAAWWLSQKADASTRALLDRAILGLDTESSMYDETNRSVADYAWEWVSGGATGAFWVMAPGVMATFTAIGETAPGGAVLEAGDKVLRGAVKGIVENTPGIKSHYASLDEQGKEDMIDSLVTGATIGLLKGAGKAGKRAKNNTAAGKRLKQQEWYLKNVKNLFKESLEEGIKEAKFQTEVEWVNKATAEPVFENGKQVGNRWAFWDTKYAANRVVQAWIDAFKKNMQEGLDKAKRAKTQLAEVNGEIPAGFDVDPTPAGWAPTVTTSKWVVGKAKDIVETRVTGISPEEKIRIQNDPYVMEKWNKAKDMMESSGMPMEDSLITENLYNEIWDKILKTFDDIESQLSESWPVYNDLRNLDTKYSMIESLPEVNKLLDANDIISTPGWLDFSNSKFVSDADMRSVQRALDMIVQTISKPLTPREYLNLRTKLSELAKYSVVDASRGQSLIRQMRHAVDQVAKKEIPGLKDVDKITSQKLNEIKKLKDWWVYKGGDRKGEVRNNFYSIIKNLTGENRKVMMNNLKKYYPGIDEEIEAVHLTQKLLKAYNKSPDIVKWLWLGWGIVVWASWWFLPGILWALIWEMIQEWVLKPRTKSMRKKAIDKITSEMSPEAKKKLEEIARKQTYAKELSKEDQAVLERVVDLIQKERNRSLSEASLRKRKEEQYRLNQPALPKAEADVADGKGNVKLARGTGITPAQYNLPRRITEINLSRPEVEGTKWEAQIIQDNLNVTPSVAEDIQDSVLDFLEEIGANKEGTLNPKEVDYSKFSTESLNELYESDLPKTEIQKIEQELSTRWEGEDKTEQEYAYKIRQIEEQEQRIGKVGKNKVNNAYKEKQMREWEAKKERLIEELGEQYWLDANWALDKYNELRDKPYSFIEGYKQSPKFIDEQAERIVLDRLKAEWDKMPKFLKEMTEEQQTKRQEFLDDVELLKWYEIETTPYNDRYIKKENWQTIDYWAIRYLDNWKMEVVTKDIWWFLSSWLLNYLPDDTIIRETGNEAYVTAQEIREEGWNVNPSHYITDANWFRRIDADTDISKDNKMPWSYTKFEWTLTIEQVREWRELYQTALWLNQSTAEQIDIARKRFAILNQQDWYTTALWLDQWEVNKQIASWVNYKPGVKELIDSVRKGKDPKNRYTGIENMLMWLDDVVNESALESFVKSIKWEPGMPVRVEESKEMVKIMMALNTHIIYDLLSIEFTNRNNNHLIWWKHKMKWFYVSDIDKIMVGRWRPFTLEHEIWHYVDCLWWRQLYWNDNWNDWASKWWKMSTVPHQAKNFAKDMLKFVSELDDNLEPWMNWDDVDRMDEATAQGKSYKEMLDAMYRSKPAEKFARFVQAFYWWVKYISENWIDEKSWKEWKSEHWDTYKIEKFKEFMKLLQDKAKLDNMWVLKEAKTHNTTGKTMLDTWEIYADIQQQGLFDEWVNKKELRNRWMEIIKQYPQQVIGTVIERYDPDIVEWKSKVSTNQATLTQLYELKNIAEDLIKNNIDRNILETADERMSWPSLILQDLIDRIKEWKKQKVSTYDKKQIQKIWHEMNSALAPRITDVSKYLESMDSDVYESEFVPQVLYTIGKTYNPDIEVWQKNLKEPLKELMDQYPKRKTPNADTQIIRDDALNSLKAKINELEKYSIKDIQNAFEWQEAEVFMRAVKKQIDKLNAEGMNNAVKNLVALHNMDYKNFEKQIKNFDGKSPMPSIAVMDPNVPHEVFGDLTLVFWKDTVDPKANTENKLYGSDAWTPMFPNIRVSWWMPYDVVKKFADDAVDYMIDNWVELDPSEAWYLASDLKNMVRELDERKDLKINASKYAEQIIQDLYDWWYEDFIANNEWAVAELEWKIEDFLSTVDTSQKEFIPGSYFKSTKKTELSNTEIEQLSDEITKRLMLNPDMQGLWKEDVYDDIKSILEENHNKWVDAILDWIKENYDIDINEVSPIINKAYNEWEPQDRPLTPENILEAMKNQRINRTVEPGSFRDMIEIEGHNLKDVEDARKQNFAKVFHGDRTGDLWDLEKRYDNLVWIISEELWYQDAWEWKYEVETLIKENYNTDVNKFKNARRPDIILEDGTTGKAKISEDVLQRIIDVVEQGKKIPIRFAESKPERIVDLYKEVQYILVPEWDMYKAENIVKGTPLEWKIIEYIPDEKTSPRSRKLKELQKKYWNVFFSMWWAIFPIATLLRMAQQLEWDDTATA